MNIPKLETERLILRAPVMEDWPDYLAIMTSERSRLMGGPYSEENAWGWFCHDVAQWQLMGHGALMLAERLSGKCIGQVGINHGPLFPETELGWMLFESAEGQGYAFEAAKAMLEWALETRKPETLVSYIDPDNARSIALAKRLGGKLDVEAKRVDPGDLVYRYQ